MDLSWYNLNLYDLFLKENKHITCASCGSQRCDCSPMWIEGCQLYQQFKKHILDKSEDLTELQ